MIVHTTFIRYQVKEFKMIVVFNLLFSCSNNKDFSQQDLLINDEDSALVDSGEESSTIDSGEEPIDNDADGYFSNHDCDDQDASVYPGADEQICDGKDNDCNGIIDDDLPEDWYADPSKWEVMATVTNQQNSPYPHGMIITSTGEKWVLINNVNQDNRSDLYLWSEEDTQFYKMIEIPEDFVIYDMVIGENDLLYLVGNKVENDTVIPIVYRIDPNSLSFEELEVTGTPQKARFTKAVILEGEIYAAGQEFNNNEYYWRLWKFSIEGGEAELIDSFTLNNENLLSMPMSIAKDDKGNIWVGGWASNTSGNHHAILRKTTPSSNETVVDLWENSNSFNMTIKDLEVDRNGNVLMSIYNNYMQQYPYWQLARYSVHLDTLDIFDSLASPLKVPDGIFQHPTGVLFVIGNDNNGFAFIKAGPEDSLEHTWTGNQVGLGQGGDFTIDLDGSIWAYTWSWSITGNPSVSGQILRYQCQ
jgi:hypothetical protein